MSGNQQTRKILILSANPKDTNPLRLDEEKREIIEGLRRAKHRDYFSIETVQAVRYRDIQRAILDHEPDIIHFSGHGEGEEGLIFEDETGHSKLVDGEAIAQLFKLFADKLECVVLNACYSQVQAEKIAQHINYVVGMSKEILDTAALEFSVGFYDALGAGKDYQFAYKLGCNSISIAGIIDEHLIPKLLKKQSASGNSAGNNFSVLTLEYPEGHVPIDSPFYIERGGIENQCYQALEKPGSLLRIKAPQ